MSFFVGVDVGTGSARAGIFDAAGDLLASHKQDIRMWRAAGGIAEQSSDDIWQAVCASVRAAVAEAGVAPDQVQGLGFDAACSMAVLDRDMQPLSISASGEAARNVIVWMDHRAKGQAERINATGGSVLHRPDHGLERQKDGGMPRLVVPGRFQDSQIGPFARRRGPAPFQHRFDGVADRLQVGDRLAGGMGLHDRGGGLAQGTGPHLLAISLDPPVRCQLDVDANTAAAERTVHLNAGVGIRQSVVLRQAAGQRQDAIIV